MSNQIEISELIELALLRIDDNEKANILAEYILQDDSVKNKLLILLKADPEDDLVISYDNIDDNIPF